VWLLVAVATRYSSAAALAAAVAAPIVTVLVTASVATAAIVLVLSAILVWRHAENIRRLRAGTEGKIGGKKSPPPDTGE
jgi:glycerol-3-phosphate acyltransferase PlsY